MIMATGGYVKLWRSLLDTTLWDHPSAMVLFIYLLLQANFKVAKVYVRGQALQLEPGQLLTSHAKLCSGTGLSRKSLRGALDVLEAMEIISLNRAKQRAKHPTVVTICNWERYQGNGIDEGQAKGQARAKQGPSKGHILRREERQKDRIKQGESARDVNADPAPRAGNENSGISELARQVVAVVGKITNRNLTEDAPDWEPVIAKMDRQGITAHRQLKVLDWWEANHDAEYMPRIVTKWHWQDKFPHLETRMQDETAVSRRKVYLPKLGGL